MQKRVYDGSVATPQPHGFEPGDLMVWFDTQGADQGTFDLIITDEIRFAVYTNGTLRIEKVHRSCIRILRNYVLIQSARACL